MCNCNSYDELLTLDYENIHSHSFYSNIMTHDSVISRRDIAKRAKELGHQTLSCLEHGYAGNLLEAHSIAKEFDLKLIYGTEFYYVKDRHERDRTNAHILIVARTEEGRGHVNRLISEASKAKFAGKPRIDEELLFSLPPEHVIVTSACIASPFNIYDDEYSNYLMEKCKNHFKDNFYLEIQPHTNEKQQVWHEKLKKYQDKYDIPMILGVDTHYIYESDAKYRDIYIQSKGIFYPEEEGFIMDYPSVETLVDRFKNQRVLEPHHYAQAMNNTLIVRGFEGVHEDDEIKMPTLYKGLSHEEKVKELQKIITKAWIEDRKHIPKEKWNDYLEAIRFETSIIINTKMEDYFLLNYHIIKKATEEYDGVLTRTGRGSGASTYVNKLLGFTEVDRLEAPVTLYPTRFMSESRILEAKSLPDIDFNTADPEPFYHAMRDYLGENSVYPMASFGTMQEKDAFKTYCRGLGMDIKEYVSISEDLDRHRNSPNWKNIINESKRFIGVVVSVSIHPCAYILSVGDTREEIGIIDTKEGSIAVIDSKYSDKYNYLKNDILTVTVWNIISEVYKSIGQPIDDIRSLVEKTKGDRKVWELYEKGIVATLNQAGTPSGKPQVMRYKPKDIRELSMWVAGIRPSFASLKEIFLSRGEFSYGIESLDELLQSSDNFILFQENIMAVLQYAGFPEDETYGLIKAISKKTDGVIDKVHEKFINGFVEKTGSEDDAKAVWRVLEDAVGYGFNSSHAYAVALDSLYGAYLKANYPLEYYTVTLNIYKKRTDKQAEMINELGHFGIKLKGLEFGQSQSDYSFDKNTNTIYKGISTVSYMNSDVAERLYKLGKEREYNDFIDLSVDIINESIADNRQMNILIKLGYFSKFGSVQYLLEIYNTLTEYQKKKINPVLANGWSKPVKYSKNHKEATKEVRIKNMREYAKIVEDNLDLLPEIGIYERLTYEIEYMGYATTIDMSLPDNYYVVMEVNTKYTPVYKIYNLFDGHEAMYKIDKKKAYKEYDKNGKGGNLILNVGDVFELNEYSERPKMQMIDGKWVANENVKQRFIESLRFIDKDKENIN